MVNARLGPVTYKVQVDEAVLNKHMDHMKAVNSQTGQEQNIPSPSEQPERVLEPMALPLCLALKRPWSLRQTRLMLQPQHLYCLKKWTNFFRDALGKIGGL
eukprot:g35311.t1